MLHRLRIVPGQTVTWKGRKQVVLNLSDLNNVVIRDMGNGKTTSVPTVELQPDVVPASLSQNRQDLMQIPDEDWAEAWRRFETIRPLLDRAPYHRSSQDVKEIAKKAKRDPVTIYRWLARYEETGLVSALLRPRRNDVGKSRLTSEVDAVLNETIQEFYLTKQRRSPSETCVEVARRCKEANLLAPHPNTIRARISQISEKTRLSKRFDYKLAREKFEPIKGSFPGADVPLAVVQIDHTPVDLTLVDDGHRLPIGRPYLTLAIDVYSRMVTGFYISLDPPGALSAGLCVANAVLPKDNFLAKLEIATPWPIWGKMRKIYVDNAKEFRGTMLERACCEHGIILEHRPKGQPNYGGHVERAFLTFMQKTHTVAGTTFSNTKEKGRYDTDKHASMTLSEFERWFTIFIVEVYHQRGHKGIAKVPPIQLYEQAILGTDTTPGIGLPMRVADEQKFRLDFTPYIERTVQEYGVVIDNIYYYSDVLRRWIHARDPENPKLKRKFIFARDPRDISVVYFLDPESRTYWPVPYRDGSRPPISLWELNAVLKHVAASHPGQPNEELIFEGVRKMREIEQAALEKTSQARKARRVAERRRNWVSHPAPKSSQDTPLHSGPADDYPGAQISPFDDIQEAE